ncbi:MAG: hypothetical protein QNK32_01975 [Porticoccus sp.]|nr:hypothetical protein [Porticoccus sp.]
MKQVVEHIYTHAAVTWDGSFAALDDTTKDNAVKFYLLTEAQSHLDEIFPPCCNGSEVRLLKELYRNPETFRKLYFILMTDHDMSECFESQHTRIDERVKLSRFVGQLDCAFAEIWGDIIYRYCENTLIEACETFFDVVEAEDQRARAEEYSPEAVAL